MARSTRHRVKRSNELKEHNEHKQQLIDTPLEVLVEIFSFLQPLDLLHLSRTTKTLRAFLLSRRTCSALWKSAINNVGDLPPCPDHMSPPAYAHLAFVPVCHGCFCPCETIEWELRMRYCLDCFPKMTVPRVSAFRDSTHSYLNDLDLPVAVNHYKLVVNSGLDITFSCETVFPTFSFSLSDWKLVQSRKRPRNVSPGEFLTQQNDFWKPIRRHASLCQNWERGRLEENVYQLLRMRQRRIADVKRKLEALGWTEVIWSMTYNRDLEHDFLGLPEVGKLECLTSTEWTEIRPQLVSWAQRVNAEMVRNRHRITIDSTFLDVQKELRRDTSLKVQPRWVDIVPLPAVRSVIESTINSNKSEEDLKEKLGRVFRLAIRKWSSDAIEELERFSRAQLGLPPLSKPSCLPSVIFRCKVCSWDVQRGPRFTFDKALSHYHLYKGKRKDKRRSTREMSIRVVGRGACARDIQVLQVDVIVSRRVDNLIRRMGQNPSRVAYDDLCRSTVRVLCGLCGPQDATRMYFGDAFKHCLNTHLCSTAKVQWYI